MEKRREKQIGDAFVKAVPEILARYGDVLASGQSVYLDENLLPVKKPLLKAALKAGWVMAKTEQQREWIRVGWIFLSTFQPGIGDDPVDGKTPPDASPEEVLRLLTPFQRIAAAAELDAEADRPEFVEYIRKSSN
jgi:hypothetical protein